MNFAQNLAQALSGSSLLALPLALLGGLVAGVNPCCLALYPAVAGSCCLGQESTSIRRSFGNALAFVFGVAVAIAALGLAAAYVGRITQIATPVKYLIALIPIPMGVYRLGWVELPDFAAKPIQSGFGGAFGTGLLLSLVLGPLWNTCACFSSVVCRLQAELHLRRGAPLHLRARQRTSSCPHRNHGRRHSAEFGRLSLREVHQSYRWRFTTAAWFLSAVASLTLSGPPNVPISISW